MNAYAEKEDLYKAKSEYYEKALMQIRDKFEDKHELHKDDIFCYNVAKEVLGE